MSKERYRVSLPDLTYFQRSIPCQYYCPVKTDARGYVEATMRGDYERAYLIARETNPFASTCGWVCAAPCEAACRRGEIDAPIAIRALKRFVDDRFGVYLEEPFAGERPDWPAYIGPGGGFDLGNSSIPTGLAALRAMKASASKDGKRVAVVGAGPAGMTCAHDLALLGHQVTIFEASSVPGGMLWLGVPGYRLPRELIELEILAILALGPEIKFGQSLGVDFSLADLRSEFDAVFLGIGTYGSRKLNIEGEDQDGVLRAVDFLINVNLGGYNLDLGDRVLVIGGGDVAMDAARSAARLGGPPETGGDLETALDAARTALRLGATKEVGCLVVEGREEMLATPFEIEEALVEGVEIHNRVIPKRIISENGKGLAIETIQVSSTYDDQGRFNPQTIPDTERIWPCDSVIVAIGQVGELDWITPGDGLETNRGGTVRVDRETLATTAVDVYAGGDIAFGPRLIIDAVADGQRAARSIHTHLSGAKPELRRRGNFRVISKREYEKVGPIVRSYMRWPLRMPPTIPIDRRIGVSVIEETYKKKTAKVQAGRCLICSINPIFEGQLCILCNGCVDVCPTDCLKLVRAQDIEGDAVVDTLFEKRGADPRDTTVMLFDPRACIRCGLCAARCPTDAVRMEDFRFVEEDIFPAQE